ncbi:hypothetical protein BD626DRAFT_564983 [Schizophyllum amplum]|uniref:Uncharacterized protein n=1 Tax=Schizophyllum amplum TaxID=97359 RepID=A0A550CTJ8_9AGAR|nr:hypothetical protein BD626DRAFT_564983 [Auriculariopsis ampla]
MAEPDIDPEALQAQVDLSMSFADSLVSSWLKPASMRLQRSTHDFEAELKEHMRRPPRLGVGASAPQAASLTREQVKLKYALTRKKRAHDDNDASGTPADREDDQESRGKAIQKRARLDPFAGSKKRKKKDGDGQAKTSASGAVKAEPADANFTREDSTSTVQPSQETSEVQMLVECARSTSADDASASSDKSQRRKKKKKPGNAEGPNPPPDVATTTTNASAAEKLSCSDATPKASDKAKHPAPLEASDTPSNSVEKPAAPAPTANPAPASLSTKLGLDADLLKQRLLNLDGPPQQDESDDDDETKAGAAPGSPSKKRRRRKKKKKGQVAAAATTDQTS